MRVIATLIIAGTKETRIEGVTDVFDRRLSYEGSHKRLAAIGFWLSSWKYAGHGGPNNKSRVFCPWTSCLMVEEVMKC
ncbi:hypothetical protein ES703_87651 [subsurface metagenome]